MDSLDAFYAKALGCTVIHGSCIQVKGKNILLVGKRLSGKTTLSQYLTLEKGGKFLHDDCIYVVDKTYVGFNMPLPVRSVRNSRCENYFIGQTIDFDGVTRYLYSPLSCVSEMQNVDFIVFPTYNTSGENRIDKLSNAYTFKVIINNIRQHGKMKIMFNDINHLVTFSKSYKIKYTSSERAYDFLEMIISGITY